MICGQGVANLKARLKAFKEPTTPVIDLAQLKGLLTTYYSTPWAVLERSDNTDGLPDAKAIEYKLVDVPTTGHTLADCLTWHQLKSIMTRYSEENPPLTDYLLRVWCGQSENPEFAKVTAEKTHDAIKRICRDIGDLL